VVPPEEDPADQELVVVSVRPHWYALIKPILVVPAVTGPAVAGVVAVPAWPSQALLRYVICAVAGYLLLRFGVLPGLRWAATRYVITTGRLVISGGLLRRFHVDVPMDQIGEVGSRSFILEHLFGCGTLEVDVRDSRGGVELPRMPHVRDVGLTLHRLARYAER
jgi:membrane protein YdbS with pleckstrin-like domain